MFRLAGKFLGHVVPGVVKPLHVLWNQLIGFLFVVFAATTLLWAVRDFRDPEHSWKLFLEVPFLVIMTIFGLASFFRARRISRS